MWSIALDVSKYMWDKLGSQWEIEWVNTPETPLTTASIVQYTDTMHYLVTQWI